MATANTRRGKPLSIAGYHRILWPTDFSRLARTALPHAVGLAASGSAELLLLHVLPSPAAYATPDVAGAAWIPAQRKVRAAAKARLHALEEQVTHAHVRTHAVVAEGLPARQILRVAKRLHCDLIVLATHGRTGFLQAVVGSVTEDVLRRAPCPVLTVRPPKHSPSSRGG